MPLPVIEGYTLSKRYRLGAIGPLSLRETANRWWERMRGHAQAPDKSDFWALREVSFSIQPGEVVGIVGRNGAGKSTLLKILSRITEPTSGRAVIRGRVASLLEVGTGFHPDLTGRENVFLNGAILGMTRGEIRRKFDEIVAFAEVENFIDTPVKRYSSGMYVRLAFAVAAHLEPEILIVDEVLAVGDVAFQKKCLGKLNAMSSKTGRTVLFVSHNMEAVRSLCTRGIHMSGGRVKVDGPVDTAIESYLSEFSRSTNSNRSAKDKEWECFAECFAPDAPSGHIQSGKPAILRVSCFFRGRADLPDVNVGIGIHSSDGLPIIVNCSLLYELAYRISAGPNVIETRIDKLPLPPGKYGIYLRLERAGQNIFLPGTPVGEFDVVENCFFPASHLMALYGKPVVYCDFSWAPQVDRSHE